ncbi:hypothetical protein ACKZDW_04270 (plasmid) [Ralstonia syzygii subsp. celebesensis]|uniref:hypothetical protein n=1 Tax=Ralstonia syzygii TaxID=28097 RepID=UPI00387E1EF3
MGIETIALGVIAAGSLLGAGSAIYGGMAARDQAETQAELSRRQAAQDQDAAMAQAEKIRRAARIQQGEATANLAASGVSVGAGTPLRISNEIYKNSEQDAYQTILSGNRAYASGQAQAGIYDAAGSNAMTTGFLNAGSSLLGGVSAMYRSGWAKQKAATGTGSIQ